MKQIDVNTIDERINFLVSILEGYKRQLEEMDDEEEEEEDEEELPYHTTQSHSNGDLHSSHYSQSVPLKNSDDKYQSDCVKIINESSSEKVGNSSFYNNLLEENEL